MNHGTFVDPSTLLALVHGCPLGRLGGVEVVLLGELHVAQELGVHALHLKAELGVGLPGGVPVLLPRLIVISVVLGLGHGEVRCDRA